MNRLTHIINILMALLACQDIFADEGMWMINDINRSLETKMQERGLKLSAHEIYNADAEGTCLADAIVSLDFGCTGSVISRQGLVITNHHCAYSDVHALSTPEQNLLEEGFWARNILDERPIPHKKAYLLKRVVDVTAEAEKIQTCEKRKNRPCGTRRLSSILEKRWARETGLEAWLYSMWKGEKYYMALYEVYTDIRLVAAPPVCLSAFGGDIDNWEWPQHKCDFAMYRIYTAPDGRPAEYAEENVPLQPATYLNISTEGYRAGDFTMILGYPGRTNRNSSSFEANFDVNVNLPVCNELRGEQMKIMNGWMNRDEKVRLQYADHYFSLSNIQEMQAGEVACSRRFKVIDRKRKTDEALQQWILARPERCEKWGNLLPLLEEKYKATEEIEKNTTYFRETLIRGVHFNRVFFKLNALRNDLLRSNGVVPKRTFELEGGPDPVEEKICRTVRFRADDLACGGRKGAASYGSQILEEYKGFDLRLEKDLFFYALKEYYEHVKPEYWGPYQKELYKEYKADTFDVVALANWLWENSVVSDWERMRSFLSEEHTFEEYRADPLYRFFEDVKITGFSSRLKQVEGSPDILSLNRQYAHALHQMKQDKGWTDYPDANSSMRITYGTVGGIEPRDAVINHWYTTTRGIIEKYDPNQYEYRLVPRQRILYREQDWGPWENSEGQMQVNFMTDNDITGGNSGSPVLNAEGKLIGLAFDGNKESLASDLYHVDGYNKCICVDIRYILWTLDRYAQMDRILLEIGCR